MTLPAAEPSIFTLQPVSAETRTATEHFIRDCFAKHYGADVQQFMPTLLALCSINGEVQGALGLRLAAREDLFCEQYVSGPIEQLMGCVLGQPPERELVVEVGQLAALDAGSARALIIHATAYLAAQGLRYVVFTGTRQLRNSFARLGLRPQFIAQADAERLGAAKEQWGDYYSTTPQVMFGDIQQGDRQLRERGAYAALGIHLASPEVHCA